MKKVAVIGSGIGGLATSIRLALKNYDVSVFEANSYFGGKLSSIEKEGFTFDAGPSLFTAPENIEALFSLAKKDISSYFTYRDLDESCRYFFANGKKIVAKKSIKVFADEAEKVFGEPAENTLKYLQNSKKAYQNIGELFLDFPLDLSLITKSVTYKALFSVKFPYIAKSLNSYNESSFKTPEMIQLFNRFATYNGSNPYKAPAMLSMISSLEQSQGTFYPDGGMISITKALVQLAKDIGVKFQLESKVEKIETLKETVTGVFVNGKKHEADIVVSNMDIYYTYKNLLSDKKFADKVLKQERSSSAFIFYWGIDTTFSELGLHNIFFSEDYKKEFQQIFEESILPDEPTIYVNVTSKFDKSHAPNNSENWFVMVNAPAHKEHNWEEQKEKVKKFIIKQINKQLNTNLENHIVVEETLSPLNIQEKTASFMGSLYGTSSNSKMAAFFRQQNRSKHYKNLYFCGGSVHPGGGIPLCFKSAKLVADDIE
ncbi:1-hydroxycarotenoid 3,4-desaturase CrtD [Polaribacter sp. MED152]|uniref:1-hydroxycarotenoid 3,4-desaturase CrtD n=1 Tax=Polaribacter sp. MED152 TaxID=313598 RepID=UPI000068CB92|nr:1-hydroxycarotenoid 3,4-desaturase CrtD [Polaribacter sp. MED152]EAQ41563.1 phytoene dehydrogenase (phytoene desaturase) [Polaribacter sp. MED152]